MTNPEKRLSLSWKTLFWVPAILFLWWALRNAPFHEIGALLATLNLPSVLFIICLNIVIFLGFSGRWKFILRKLGRDVPLLRLVSYRLAGFAISYFTPGTQVGGEPMQAFLLTKNHPVARDEAISSIYLDKLIELIVNFSILMIGLAITLGNSLFRSKVQPVPGFILAAIGLSPLVYFFLLWKGKQPAEKLMVIISGKFPANRLLAKACRIVHTSESRIRSLIREKPDILGKTIGISLIVWALMILEFHLMWIILGLPLRLADTVLTMTLARAAFLLPLPGGIGALEAGQVMAMQILGRDPAAGLAACFWIRGRDITFGALGFLIAGIEIQTEKIKLN